MIRLTGQLAFSLKHRARRAIRQACQAAANEIVNRPVPPGQHEAWHVAHLCASTHRIATSWRKEFNSTMPGISLSMSSVFTHQRPFVRWPYRNSTDPKCELADLMIAVIDRTGISTKNHAILIQAKLSDTRTLSLKDPREKRQYDLLSRRPIFDVVSAGSPEQVNLRRYSPDSALMYGLTSKYPTPSCLSDLRYSWATADDLGNAKPYVVLAESSLPSILIGLLQGNFGWLFDLSPAGQCWKFFTQDSERDDWSMLINYLLEETFRKPLSAALQVPADQINRGNESPMFMVAQSPNKLPMFFISDGFDNSIMKNLVVNDNFSSTEWKSSNFANFNGDGGSINWEINVNEREPIDGPISAIVIEVGRKD